MRHYRRSQRVGEKLVKGELKMARVRSGCELAGGVNRLVNSEWIFSNADRSVRNEFGASVV